MSDWQIQDRDQSELIYPNHPLRSLSLYWQNVPAQKDHLHQPSVRLRPEQHLLHLHFGNL